MIFQDIILSCIHNLKCVNGHSEALYNYKVNGELSSHDGRHPLGELRQISLIQQFCGSNARGSQSNPLLKTKNYFWA